MVLRNGAGSSRYRTHVPTTLLEKAFIASTSAIRALADPRRARDVAAVGETTGAGALRRMHLRMSRDPVGQRVLHERPLINTETIPPERLRAMPHGTFGHAYATFLDSHGFSPDERDEVMFVDDEELAYVMLRYRQVHDLWHVLTEYGRDELGEACLLGFTYAQNKNRGVGFIAFVGCFKLYRRHGLSAARSIFNAYLDGRRAAWLPQQDWEALLHEPIESVRKKLKISSPVLYQTCRDSYLIGS